MTTTKYRRTVFGLAIVAMLALCVAPSFADVQWDPLPHAGASGGGAGTWDGSAQWWNGTTDVALGGGNALFTNTGGAITVSGSQSVGNMTFNGSGYTFTGGTINMAGGFGIFGSQSATINSTLNDTGTVFIANTYTGTVTLGGTDTVVGFQANGGTIDLTGSLSSAGGAFYTGNGGSNGGTNGDNGTLRVESGATLNVNVGGQDAWVIGRDSGHGTVNQVGGSVTVTNNSLIVAANGTGAYNLSGGTLNLSNQQLIDGGFGTATGSFTISNSAQLSGVTDFRVGFASSTANGTLTINGGTIGTGDLRVGDSGGNGTVIQTAGTVNIANYFNMGAGGNGTASYTLSGTGQINDSGDFTVGENSTNATPSTFTQNGGKVNQTGGVLYIGRNGVTGFYTLNSGTLITPHIQTGGTGTLKLNGGILSPNNDDTNFIDSASTNLTVLVQSGGAIIDSNSHNITITHALVLDSTSTGGGLTKQGAGTLTLSGTNTYTGGTTVSAGTLQAGGASAFGTSGLTVNGGTFDLNSQTLSFPTLSGTGGTITDNNGTAGVTTLTINETGTTSFAGSILSGTNRTIAFKQNGSGTLSLSGANTIGQFQVNAGGLTISGGTTAVVGANTGAIFIGNGVGATGTLTISSGAALNVSGAFGDNLVIGRDGGSGTLTQNGGTLDYNPSNRTELYIGASNNAATTSVYNMNGGTLNLHAKNIDVGLGVGVVDHGTLNVATGATISNVGTLFVGANAGIGLVNQEGGSVSVSTQVQFDSSQASVYNLDGGTLQTPAITKAGSSASTLNLNGGTLQASATGTLISGLDHAYVNNGGASFDTQAFTSTVSQSLEQGLGGSTGGLTKLGVGTLILSGANSYAGGNTLTGGTLRISGAGTLGATTGPLAVNASTTLDLGATSQTVGAVTIVGGTIQNGTLTGTGFTSTGGTTSAALAGSGASLTHNSGTLTMSGASTYSGATTINSGSLVLSGAGSINGSSGVTINGGSASLVQISSVAVSPTVTVTTGTLDGTGTINSAIVGDGLGGIVTNGNGGTAALTVGALTFNGVGTITANVGSPATPGIAATTLTTGAVNAGGIVTVNANNTVWTNGQVYNLISYGTLSGPGFSSFAKGTIANLGARQAATLTNPTGLIAISIAGDLPIWTGVANGNWTSTPVGAPYNWKKQSDGSPTEFLATNDTPLFDDTATGTTAVNISDANVSPASTTFNNSTKNYTVSSTGGFGIAGGVLVKSGSATLTITTANTYSGGTTLNAGTLNLNNVSAIGSGTLTVAGGTLDSSLSGGVTLSTNNAQSWTGDFTFGGSNPVNMGTGAVTLGGDRTITSNGSSALTVGGGIGGAFGLTVTGAGTLRLNGANSYSGATTINSGTLYLSGANGNSGGTNLNGGTLIVGNVGALGSGTLKIAAGTIDSSVSGGTTLTTNNAQSWNGDFTFGGSNALNLGVGAVTLGGDRTVTLNGSAALTVGGPIGGGFALTTTGTGTLRLGGANTYSGGTTVTSGTLIAGNALALGATTNSLTVNGGTFDLNANNVTIGSLSGSSGTITDNNSGAGVTALTVNQSGNTTFSGSIQNGTNRKVAIVKTGAGGLTLPGSNTVGGFQANGGTTDITGTLSSAGGAFYIGNVTNGTLQIESGATVNVNVAGQDNVVLGRLGATGTVVQNGGNFNVTNNGLFVAAGGGTAGFYNLNGGTFNMGNGSLFIGGFSGTGTMTVAGGTLTNAGLVDVGYQSGAGTLQVNTGSVNTAGLIVGEGGGSGALTQSGGSINVVGTGGSAVYLGNGANATGMLTINAGSTLSISGSFGDNMVVGRDGGSGTITQNGGTFSFNMNNGYLFIGASNSTATNSVYNMNGGTLNMNGRTLSVALGTTGAIDHGALNIAPGATISNVGSLLVGQINGAGTVNQSGGSISVSNQVEIGSSIFGDNGATGTYNLDGGTLTTPAIPKTITAAGGSILNLNGGTLQAAGSGRLLIQGLDHAYVKNGGAVIDTQAFSTTVAQSLEAAPGGSTGGLTKNGTGTLVLNTPSTYSGPTVVNSGTLRLQGTANLAGAAAYYAFNNPNNIGQDSSPNGNTLATTSGSPVYSSAGKFGGALYLDGASTLGTLSGAFPKGVPTGANSYTIAAMIKTDTGVSGSGGWIGWGNNSFDNANNVRLFGANGIANYWYANDLVASTPTNLEDGNWHSVVATYDGTNEIIYIDGVNSGERTNPMAPAVAALNFIVGKTTSDANFKGWVDDLLVANRALGQTEINTLISSGVSTSTADILPVATPLQIASAASVDLNGVNQHVASLADGVGGGGGITNGGQADSTLTLNGSGVTAFSGVISDGSSNKISLVVSGGGTQTLSGASTYSGGTTLNSGTLRVANASGSATGSGGVTLNNGTLSSGTVGAISGTVAAGSGFHTIAPGGVGATGTLTLGGLTTSSSTTLNFDLGAPVSSGSYSGDLIVIGANGLTVNNGTMVSFGTNAPAVGDYRLFGGNFGTPLASNFSLPPAPMGTIYSLSYMVDSGYYDLVVSPSNLSGQWNVNNASPLSYNNGANWDSGAVPSGVGLVATFGNGNGVSIAPAPSAVTITVDALDTVGALAFTNTNGTQYVLAGDGNGAHGVTLDNSSHPGVGATVSVASNVAAQQMISTNLVFNDNVTFDVASGTSLLVSNASITETNGPRNLTLAGGGTLALDATPVNYTGTTTIQGGTLRVSASSNISSTTTPGAVLLDATGTNVSKLVIGNTQTVSNLTTLNGSGSATLEVQPGGSLTVSSTAAGLSTFQGKVQLDYQGVGATLVKDGNTNSTLVINGPTVLQKSSSLQVNNGTLQINAVAVAATMTTPALPSVGTNVVATVNSGATLELDGSVSALTDATVNVQRADVNNSGTLDIGNAALSLTAAQQVGGIDGSGSVVVADSSSLTANHINQTSLVIGNGAVFTLAPSDSSGNPMAVSSSGLVLAGSLAPSSSFVAASGNLLSVGGSASSAPLVGFADGVSGGGVNAVPEPSSLALAALSLLGLLSVAVRRRTVATD